MFPHTCKKCQKAYSNESPANGYCSKECRETFNFKFCETCGGVFYKKRKTRSVASFNRMKNCSRECAAKSLKIEKVERLCKTCAKPFMVLESSHVLHCSLRCGNPRIQIPLAELIWASKTWAGASSLAVKYDVHASIITRRLKEVGLKAYNGPKYV